MKDVFSFNRISHTAKRNALLMANMREKKASWWESDNSQWSESKSKYCEMTTFNDLTRPVGTTDTVPNPTVWKKDKLGYKYVSLRIYVTNMWIVNFVFFKKVKSWWTKVHDWVAWSWMLRVCGSSLCRYWKFKIDLRAVVSLLEHSQRGRTYVQRTVKWGDGPTKVFWTIRYL